MMIQLAMDARVCQSTRFWQISKSVKFQAVGPALVSGLTSHPWRSDWPWAGQMAGNQTGHGWWSDRPKFSVEFWAGPKIEGVSKREDSCALGLIIFGASSQKFYSFWISREGSYFQGEILAKSVCWRSDRPRVVWLTMGGGLTGFSLFVGRQGDDDHRLSQFHGFLCIYVAWCMFWLTWVKLWRTYAQNRFLCLLLCRRLGGQWRSTVRMIETRLGERRSRTIEDAG